MLFDRVATFFGVFLLQWRFFGVVRMDQNFLSFHDRQNQDYVQESTKARFCHHFYVELDETWFESNPRPFIKFSIYRTWLFSSLYLSYSFSALILVHQKLHYIGLSSEYFIVKKWFVEHFLVDGHQVCV